MSIKLLKKIHCMVEAITGRTFFIAGGAVVDTLYGKEPKDYDMVLPVGDVNDAWAHDLIEELSRSFSFLGFSTKVYQSYGVNMGEEINDTSFQAMFYSCMKVDMGHCQLDILLSKAHFIQEHVQRHDCNMNMVWFDGKDIRWEHDGDTAKVERLEFREGVCDARINRMDIKRHELTKLSNLAPFN
ncbi:MAG: hypothetical protein ACRDB3_17735 [Citrobacter telavivensis]